MVDNYIATYHHMLEVSCRKLQAVS